MMAMLEGNITGTLHLPPDVVKTMIHEWLWKSFEGFGWALDEIEVFITEDGALINFSELEKP